MSFVEIIAALVRQKGINEKTFLQDLGFNKNAMSDWRSGKTKSYMSKIDLIADYFNISIDYLLGREQVPSSLSDLEKELIKYFRSLDNSGQTAVLRTAKNEYQVQGSNAQHSRIVSSLKKQDCAEDSKVLQR